MRVLLDTNIVLDWLLARDPWAADARDVWLACEDGRCTGYLAAISLTNIWYIGRRLVGADAARQHREHPASGIPGVRRGWDRPRGGAR